MIFQLLCSRWQINFLSFKKRRFPLIVSVKVLYAVQVPTFILGKNGINISGMCFLTEETKSETA